MSELNLKDLTTKELEKQRASLRKQIDIASCDINLIEQELDSRHWEQAVGKCFKNTHNTEFIYLIETTSLLYDFKCLIVTKNTMMNLYKVQVMYMDVYLDNNYEEIPKEKFISELKETLNLSLAQTTLHIKTNFTKEETND